jgi:long-subunit acyl-CoA synthetase (AMP-forming)
MEAGEITPTLKVRRRAVQEHFADEIDALYAQSHLVAPSDD